jgi:hypothetical protein
MASYNLTHKVPARRLTPAWILALAGFGLGWLAPTAMAKEPSLTAIELYDGPSGAAYVQLTDVLINTKAEMKDCTPYQQAAVDHSTYNKMELVHLAPGGVLERGSDGVMHYTVSGATVCVVPLNVKTGFEHGASASLSDLADQALLGGAVSGPPGGAPPKILKGVKLVFVPATNVELAEFLRAERANTIVVWQNYLATNPASHPAHNSAAAKAALASLFVNEGEVSLQAYEKTQNLDSPSYSDLKAAKGRADQARAIWPDLPDYKKLDGEVHRDLTAITDKGSAELNDYHTALKSNTTGYNHLLNAKKFSDILSGIDSFFPPAQALLEGVTKDINDFEGALRSAQTNLDGKQYDQAYQFVAPYRAFADEEPRVAAVIDTAYMSHMTQGNNFGRSGNWQGAINEFDKASGEKDTPASRDALKNAHVQYTIATDKAAAAKALAASQDYQGQKQWIEAYEAFDALTPAQQAIDADAVKAIEPNYIQTAAAQAKKLHTAHPTFIGVNDKEEREKAYHYYDRAWLLSNDEKWKDARDAEGEDLSAYLLQQGKAFLAKPGGSGTELGWAYLDEAFKYKAENHDAVRDAEQDANQNHSSRSNLWINISFQDQTSERYNAQFYSQLESAIIHGLDNSPLHVKATHSSEVDKQAVLKPDFELSGDVLTHDLTNPIDNDPQDSEFVSGQGQKSNPDWAKANRALQKAKEDQSLANTAMTAAATRNNKKEKEEAQALIDAAKKAAEDAQSQLDNLNQYDNVPILTKYNYTRKTQHIKCNIKLQFTITDSATGSAEIKPDPIVKGEEQTDIVLDDVSPQDNNHIKKSGSLTDPLNILAKTEDESKTALTEAVNKIVEQLPEKFYNFALAREKEDDPNVAGEFYRRYLEITRDDKTVVRDAQREHARLFLSETFDLPAKIKIEP